MLNQIHKKMGLDNPIIAFATFVLLLVAFNPDLSSSMLIWWGCLGIFFLIFILEQRNLYLDSGYIIWIVAFVLFCAASCLWAISSSVVIDQLKSMVIHSIVLIIFCSLVRTKVHINKLLKIIVAVSVCNAVYLLITNIDIIFEENSGTRLGTDSLWNANVIGMMMSMSSIILLYLMSNDNKNKKLYILGIVFLVFVSFLTGSRKAFLVVLLGISLYLMLIVRKNKKLAIFFIILFSIISIYYLIMYNPFLYSIIGWRIEGLFASITGVGIVDSSTIKRELYVKIGVQVFLDNFLVGCGLDCFRLLNYNISGYAMYAHNNYVELLADLGIIGTAIYYGIYFIIFARLFKGFKKGDILTKLVLVFMVLIVVVDYGSVNYSSLLFNCLILISFTWTKLMQTQD